MSASASDRRSVVVAHRPDNESIAKLRYEERVVSSLWFTPLLFVLGAIALMVVTVLIDRRRGVTDSAGWLLNADAESAETLAALAATVMLSSAAIVFSTTLVAIQLAGGQYSPRVVRVFVRSRLTHVTLGFFLATFVFAVAAIVETRTGDDEKVPEFTISVVYVSLAATLVVFILFVHGISKLMRVQYLLTKVTNDGRPAVHGAFPVDDAGATEVEVPPLGTGPVLLNSRAVGVVQAIDGADLVELARASGVVVALLVEAGEYVGVGTPVAQVVSGPAGSLTGDDVTARCLLGAERTLVHDPGFVFRQLVDVGIRALSPAVNDPTTAVQVIDRVNDLLGDVAGRPDSSGWYVDRTGLARLHLREPGLERLMLLAYVELIRYGADSPQVVRRLRAAFDVLEPIVRPDLVPTVGSLRAMLDEAADDALPGAFREVSNVPDRHGLG